MANYLVTGGAGFIGSHIVDALLNRGDSVRVLDNLNSGIGQERLTDRDRLDFIQGDLLDSEVVSRAVEGIDVVFHQAALASVPYSLENPLATHSVCATGTLQLLESSRAAGVRRLVYAGSSSCYGQSTSEIQREGDVTKPCSPYGAAKLAGEQYCHAFYESYGFETVVLRYFNVFGPRQDPNSQYAAVIPIFITRMLNGQAPIVFGDGTQSRDFTFVANVVHGNLLAAEASAAVGHSINMAAGMRVSLNTLIDSLNELMGTEVAADYQPERAGDIKHSSADISLARELLGYEPVVSLQDGIRETLEYYKSVYSAKN